MTLKPPLSNIRSPEAYSACKKIYIIQNPFFHHWYEQHVLLRCPLGSFYVLNVWSTPQTCVTQMFFWVKSWSSCIHHQLLLHITVCKPLFVTLCFFFFLIFNSLISLNFTICNIVILIFHIVNCYFCLFCTHHFICWSYFPPFPPYFSG